MEKCACGNVRARRFHERVDIVRIGGEGAFVKAACSRGIVRSPDPYCTTPDLENKVSKKLDNPNLLLRHKPAPIETADGIVGGL